MHPLVADLGAPAGLEQALGCHAFGLTQKHAGR